MTPSRECERCREQVSLELDAELTEFESAVLRRHLRACAGCRAFAADLQAVTALLRSTVPVEPGRVEVPVRRRRRAHGAAIAAATAAAAVAAAFVGGFSGDDQSGPVILPTAAAGNTDLQTLRAQRRAQLYLPSAALHNIRIRVLEID